jgi:hypothetical protein
MGWVALLNGDDVTWDVKCPLGSSYKAFPELLTAVSTWLYQTLGDPIPAAGAEVDAWYDALTRWAEKYPYYDSEDGYTHHVLALDVPVETWVHFVMRVSEVRLRDVDWDSPF